MRAMATKVKVQLYSVKLPFRYDGHMLGPGEVVKPIGERNDHVLFGDNTHWFRRFDGEPLECGSDGCEAKFDSLGSLDRHRRSVHGPEREARLRDRQEAAQERVEREIAGETIGGHEVVKTVSGPRGPVPYINPVS